MTGVLFLSCTIDRRFITCSYCLLEVCALIITLQQICLLQGGSLSGRSLTVLGQISLRCASCPNLLSEWTVPNQTKAPTRWRASNCYSSAMQHGRMHFVNHQLVPVCGGPPATFFTLDRYLFLFERPKPLLKLCMAHCFIPKSLLNHILGYWGWVPIFEAKLDADVLLNFLGHRQCTMHNNWFRRTEQSGWEAVIPEWTRRYKVTCVTLPAPSAFLFERKKYGRMLCDQATYISVQFENGICRFKSAPWGSWGCSIVFSQVFRWLFFWTKSNNSDKLSWNWWGVIQWIFWG